MTTHNIGDADVSGAAVSFYDGDPVNGILIATVNTGTIAVTGSETMKILWNATPAGTHELHVAEILFSQRSSYPCFVTKL